MKKNPHAVAMGRKGGLSRSPKKLAANKKNARFAGRKKEYQIVASGATVIVSRHTTGDEYRQLGRLTPSALVFLAAWIREHKPGMAVSWFDRGHATLGREE